jgi:protein-L-isoaspartate O-methyltransferase
VAQSGSAPGWGPGGRRFKSCLPDSKTQVQPTPATLAFARANLDRAGYSDIVLIHGDGGLGQASAAPCGRLCITAACSDVPSSLIEQLATPGPLIAPLLEGTQRLTLLKKTADGVRRTSLANVLYVSAPGTVRRRLSRR